MSQGAPIGNQNAKKAKMWADAVKRAIREKYDGEDWETKLAALARKLVDAADNGDLPALKEVGDRLDGKPAQALTVGNEDDKPFLVEKIVRSIVRPPDPDG